MSQSNKTPEYSEELLEYLQLFRGEGFLSPGGADETRRVLDRVDVENRSVLEIGSGLGGCCLIIALERGAKQVHGLDVEPVVIAKARETVAKAGLEQKITSQQVDPGPLPVDSNAYDVVFSKDAMCHVEAKESLYRELFRVLKPGGHLAAGDWLVREDGPYSDAMRTFIETAGLSLYLDSLPGVKQKLFRGPVLSMWMWSTETPGFARKRVKRRSFWRVRWLTEWSLYAVRRQPQAPTNASTT